MRAARPGSIVLVGISTAVLGWLGLRLWVDRGGLLPSVPWTALAAIVALSIAVLAAGQPVRRWRDGDRRTRLDPLVAARTVVLAKAAAYTGAVVAGWYLAQALAVLPDLVGSRRVRLLLAALCTLAAIGVSTAGLLVQHWCRLPPDDGEDSSASTG